MLRRWLEGDHAFDHEPFELPAVTDVGRREIQILLIHELDLGQNVGSEEPATTNLPTVDGHVRRAHRELTFDGVVPGRCIQSLIGQEAVNDLTDILPPGAVGRFTLCTTFCFLDVAEELEAANRSEEHTSEL